MEWFVIKTKMGRTTEFNLYCLFNTMLFESVCSLREGNRQSNRIISISNDVSDSRYNYTLYC